MSQQQPQGMREQVKQAAAEARARAEGREADEEVPVLPQSAASAAEEGVEAEGSESAAAAPAETSEEAPATEETPAAEPPLAAAAEEDEIRIGDRTFKTQAEAIKYAEQLERDKLVNEAFFEGARTARTSDQVVAPAPEDDKFEEQFYADPKATIRKVKEEAIIEAERRIDAKIREEQLWNQFLNEYPDIRRADAQRILNEKWESEYSKMRDVSKAMKLLARDVRADYAEIEQLRKPRTELSGKKVQSMSSSSAPAARVTPAQKTERVLTMAEEMRSLRKR